MDYLYQSCERSAEYPRNLVHSDAYSHVTASYVEKLDEREEELFDDETEASLDFWETEVDVKGAYHFNPFDVKPSR
jgi:hypothetical protein